MQLHARLSVTESNSQPRDFGYKLNVYYLKLLYVSN